MSDYSSVTMFVGTIPLTPIPPPRPTQPQRPKHQHPQKQKDKKKEKQNLSFRSSSSSQGTQPASRPSYHRHSRASSGSQASRSSHEVASSTDRHATSSLAVGQHHETAHHAPRQLASSTQAAAFNTSPRLHKPPLLDGLHPFDARNAALVHNRDFTATLSADRAAAESMSSTSGTSLSARTMTSGDPTAAGETPPISSKPFVLRNGRTYINDQSLQYPLPSDLTELHRQSLRTLLLIQVFGAPVCSQSLEKKPPKRVLEVGCGSGFWSMMCHRYFKRLGHGGISFTGIDIAPLAPGSADVAADSAKPDADMNWKFVNHDLRQMPWPLPDEGYDLIMCKDMSLATSNQHHQAFIDEYLRLLRPGGSLEIWDSDHPIRMLRPHVPASGDDADDQEAASALGAYVLGQSTPLSNPLNTFLVEYNNWLTQALGSRDLSPVPCTVIGASLLQESETLAKVRSRRLAIPLSEVRWEREGVGGVITKDGKSFVDAKGKGGSHQVVDKKTLTAGQSALRKTALLTVVQQIQALEPILRDVSGKSQDEWDVWLGKMMSDMMSEGGTSWGECLEVGAWWAKKKD